MSKILFLSNASFSDPKRGTPLHLCNMFREIRKEHALLICAQSVPNEFQDIFVPYPAESGIRKLRALREIVRTNGITHIFTATSTGLLAPVLLKFMCGTKIAVEIHGMSFDELYADGSIGWFRYYLLKYKVWLLLHFYNTVFVMLKKQVDYYAPMSRKWIIAHTAVVPEEVPDASSRVRDEQSFVIGYMGNGRPYQGLPFLIEAASLLREQGIPACLNLVISGDLTEVRQLIDQHHLGDVTVIHNNVSHVEAYRLVSDSSVLVIPRPSIAITEYAFPSKLPEYLATGIPVVLTEVGPVEELRAELERHAFIILADHIPEHLVEALLRVHAMSAAERTEFGARARSYALKKFNWAARGALINAQFTA